MGDLPKLTPEQVEESIPGVSNIQHVGSGGQKVVYRITINENPYALKIALVPEVIQLEDEEPPTDEVTARAQREVETMGDCTSSHMVKLGPLGLTFAEIGGQRVLYFTEEFVAGATLQEMLKTSGSLSADEVVRLGLHTTDAIKGLWELGKVHRDIKPGNVMRRESGDYVLLDAGLAFDIVGDSLSQGLLVGTVAYFSPEQFDYTSRRSGLDFRSDMFSLGVTMYQAATGKHPFWEPGVNSAKLHSRILFHKPDPPSTLIAHFPSTLDGIILRMLGKSQHLRFRTCDRLMQALREV